MSEPTRRDSESGSTRGSGASTGGGGAGSGSPPEEGSGSSDLNPRSAKIPGLKTINSKTALMALAGFVGLIVVLVVYSLSGSEAGSGGQAEELSAQAKKEQAEQITESKKSSDQPGFLEQSPNGSGGGQGGQARTSGGGGQSSSGRANVNSGSQQWKPQSQEQPAGYNTSEPPPGASGQPPRQPSAQGQPPRQQRSSAQPPPGMRTPGGNGRNQQGATAAERQQRQEQQRKQEELEGAIASSVIAGGGRGVSMGGGPSGESEQSEGGANSKLSPAQQGRRAQQEYMEEVEKRMQERQKERREALQGLRDIAAQGGSRGSQAPGGPGTGGPTGRGTPGISGQNGSGDYQGGRRRGGQGQSAGYRRPRRGGNQGGSGARPGDEVGRSSFQSRAVDKAAKGSYISSEVNEPISEYEIEAGTLVPGALVTAINSDLPGEIVGRTTRPVYGRNQEHILIPAGTKLLGSYSSSISAGQDRALLAWTRMIFPNGNSVSLPGLSSKDAQGRAGTPAEVDNHRGRLIGSAALLGVVGAGFDFLTGGSGRGFGQAQSGAQIVGNQVGRRLGQIITGAIEEQMNIPPTLEVERGKRFFVYFNRDVAFDEPYSSEGPTSVRFRRSAEAVNQRGVTNYGE